jgi:phage N-6-adenine-methyltransferase
MATMTALGLKNYLRQRKRSNEYGTPQWVFAKYDNVYHFDIDVAASHDNHKVGKYLTKHQNGLIRRWYGRAWCNPPYDDLMSWVRKAYEESLKGAIVVMLLPLWATTKWYKTYSKFAAIEILPGRLKFDTPNGKNFSAYFDSEIWVFPKSAARKVW